MANGRDALAGRVEGLDGAFEGGAVDKVRARSVASAEENGIDARGEIDRIELDRVAERPDRCTVVLWCDRECMPYVM